jgi:hypothetical protein
MPFGTGHDVKSGVIYEWLRGSSRDKIAGIYNISTGGVTNIINEWRNNIGAYIAEDLRELSISLKKANITPIQCSIGFRVAKIMQRLGITEEQFEFFMSDIYDRCQKLQLGPDQIEKYLMETINISKIVFPSQIPNYINTKKLEIENLEEQVENIKQEILLSNIQKASLEKKLNSLADSNNISRDAITWYKNIKDAFESAELSIDHVPRFIHCLNIMKSEGYDTNKILRKFVEYETIDDLKDFHQTTITIHKTQLDTLLKQAKSLQEQINLNQLKLSKIQQLEEMSIGIKELKTIYNKITEIAKENNILPNIAMDKLLDDLKDYDYILRFKNTLEKMEQNLTHLNIEIENNRRIISAQFDVGSLLQSLLGMGLTEQDIRELSSILSSGGFDFDVNTATNNIIINKQSLITDLTKYRNIKLVNKELELNNIKISKTIVDLESQKKILENYINLLLAIIYNIGDLHMILKKANVLHENPRIILIICLLYSFFKDDKIYSKDYDDSSKEKSDNHKDTDEEDE